MSERPVPRAYVACLACYVEGRYVGQWVEGIHAGEVTTEQLHDHAARAAWLYPHEELEVHDHENYLGLLRGECAPQTAQQYAEWLARLETEVTAIPVQVSAALLAHLGWTPLDGDPVETVLAEVDWYLGSGELPDICERYYLERLDPDQRALVDQRPWCYVDWDRIATDWQANGTFAVTPAWPFDQDEKHWFATHNSDGTRSSLE